MTRSSRRCVIVPILGLLSLVVWIGSLSSGSTTPPTRTFRVTAPTEVHVDFDGDHVVDRAAIENDARAVVRVSLSRGLDKWLGGHVDSVVGLAGLDFDHDGDADLIAARTDRLVVWLNNGHGRFSILAPRSTDGLQIGSEPTWHPNGTDGRFVAVASSEPESLGHLPTGPIINPLLFAAHLSDCQPSSLGAVLDGPYVPRGPPLA